VVLIPMYLLVYKDNLVPQLADVALFHLIKGESINYI